MQKIFGNHFEITHGRGLKEKLMDCQTIHKSEAHEQYLFGRLNDSEKTEYEAHLRTCETCQAELENQRQLIFGLREIGRREMKEEIRWQVEGQKSSESQIHWVRLAKIAAVLFMFVMAPSLYYIFRTQISQIVPVSPDLSSKVLSEEKAETADTEQDTQQSEIAKLAKKIMSPAAGDPSPKGQIKGTVQPTAVRSSNKEDLRKKEAPPSEGRAQETSDVEQITAPAKLNELYSSKPTRGQTAHIPGKDVQISNIERIQPLLTLPANDSIALGRNKLKPELEFSLNQENIDAKAGAQKTKDFTIYHYELTSAIDKIRMEERSVSPLDFAQTSRNQAFSELLFKSNGHVIQVHLKTSVEGLTIENPTLDEDRQRPQSFSVKILKQDVKSLEMDWYVGSDFLEIDPAEIRLEKWQDQTIRVVIKDRLIYKIDLQQESTRAILQKEKPE